VIAVILVPGPLETWFGLDEYQSSTLLPLADRPVLQHIIEYLNRSGIRRFEFITGHVP
jgi:dTDP-glucose pyrophosphorylase